MTPDIQQSGKAINDKVRLYSRIGSALLEAKQSGGDPFAAIEAIIPWEVFTESITEAELLAQPEGFDYLALGRRRRYTPTLLEALTMKPHRQRANCSLPSTCSKG